MIDAFVDALDLAEMGFEGAEPAATGRPSYHPSVLPKLYIYGYLNRVQSSRRLEREHEYLLEAVQQRLEAPEAMRQRRETVEHPFGTMRARMGASHVLTKTLPKVAAEMAIIGTTPLIAAIAV